MRISFIQSSNKFIAIFLAVLVVCIPISYAALQTTDVVELETSDDFLDGEETDIVINVLKYEPTVLVHSVVREMNAPLIVSLWGVPTTGRGIPKITHISITETDTNWLSGGVRYYAPALYSWDNLGYFETKLKKIEKLEDIPDKIDINLTATIKYEAETTTQLVGAVQTKILREKFKVDREDLMFRDEYDLFGKGYIVANNIDEDEAKFTIYDSETRKLGSPTLEIDEESREYTLVSGSKYSEDIVRVRLDEIIDGSKDYVSLEIPGAKDQYDEIVVNVGDEIGHKWKVTGFDEKSNVVFIKKEIDGKEVYLYLMKGNLDAKSYKQQYENYIKNRDSPYPNINPALLLSGLENLISDFTGGVVRVKEINKGEPRSASFEVGGNLEPISLEDSVGECKLEEIKADYVVLSRGGKEYTLKLQTQEERERKDESLLKNECEKRVLLREIHTQNIARVTVLTGRKRGEMKTSFSLHIPVDKGLIGFSDKDIKHQLEVVEKLIENFGETVDKLEKIVTNWRKVCLGVTALLVIGSFLAPTSKATGAVTSITGGAVAGDYYRLQSDDGAQLYLDKKSHMQEAWRKKDSNLLYDKNNKQVNKNIIYDKNDKPYYYNSKLDKWVVYKGLNLEEYRSIYTTRKDGQSVIVVPIRDPDNNLASGKFKDRYNSIKEEFALSKGFYVVYYEGKKLEIYQGIEVIDLGYDDDRRAATILEREPGFDDFVDRYIKKVNSAQKAGKTNVDIDGDKKSDYSIQTGREFKAPDLSCEDIFCPAAGKAGTSCWQCRILYNACDPVICPPSRCNLAGKVNPGDSVADKGLIASVVLCLPNIKWSRGGVMVPLCLSGIYGSLKTIQGILENYKLCLLKQQKEGKTFGLCERVQSIYICELVWKELAGWLMLYGGPVGGMLGLLTGGGTEYFTSSLGERATNSRRVVDFFVQSYAKEMYVNYLGKSTEEVGSEICRSYVGGKLPNIGDFVDNFATPEVSPQFTAHFEEQPYSETAGTSRYTVYYQVYAGTLKNKDRLNYYVYLMKKGERDLSIARGTLTAEGWASDTVTEVAVKGYEQICVNIDGVANCNFGKMVSSSWALDSLADKFVEGQIGKEIKSAEKCVSESEGYLGMPVERRCKISNPYKGLGESEENKWEVVGDCGTDEKGVYLGKCWMKVQSKVMMEKARKQICEEKGLEYCGEGLVCSAEPTISGTDVECCTSCEKVEKKEIEKVEIKSKEVLVREYYGYTEEEWGNLLPEARDYETKVYDYKIAYANLLDLKETGSVEEIAVAQNKVDKAKKAMEDAEIILIEKSKEIPEGAEYYIVLVKDSSIGNKGDKVYYKVEDDTLKYWEEDQWKDSWHGSIQSAADLLADGTYETIVKL